MDPIPVALVEQVGRELERLEAFADTDEARRMVREQLESKIAALGATGPVIGRLRHLAETYLENDKAGPLVQKMAGAAALYFLQTVDAIDDFLWPIGYLDDAVAVALTETRIRRLEEGQRGDVSQGQ